MKLVYEKNQLKIYKASTIRCGCYIIRMPNRNILFDTSMSFEYMTLQKDFRRLSLDFLDAIILSHSHFDHAGNAAKLSQRYNCPVYIGQKGVKNILSGLPTLPKGTNSFAEILNRLGNTKIVSKWFKIKPTDNVSVLDDKVAEQLFQQRITVLETEGHTNDSMSLIVDRNIALVGDAMINNKSQIYPPFADDKEKLLLSWDKLIRTGCDMFYPAHGTKVNLQLLTKHRKQRMYKA